MESSSTATRFQFRESENSNDSDSSSSDNGDHDSNLHSMTGKGIKLLCAELLEIKALSDDDFLRNIFSNYSSFLGVFEEVKDKKKRIDEAIAILEMEEENFKRLMVELGDIPSDVLMLYKSAISDMKAMLTLESTLVAENSRISAPELQKALVGICRLGESHLATQFAEVLSFAYSARSFMKLYGETSPFASEFIQWVYEEIEVFAVSCARYVISVSETILRKSSASLLQLMVIGERPEFCLLTSSGRNLVTVLQAITGDVTPLIALQLEDSILRGLMNLFSEYIAILEEPSPLKQMIQA
ncbi:EXOCYST COMPLEX COMPONENT 8 [Salix koriyanagi]|uniref:EXOCYST COMPLEX COMPONENT 8 n=1 Tax=Salix koriyanagi TaxID=2511006 RepID=A0A9Q0U5X1_9ROSI|nr:EXOCYST COMPLEX COMPONENT 8 [Salix koriyanagi]